MRGSVLGRGPGGRRELPGDRQHCPLPALVLVAVRRHFSFRKAAVITTQGVVARKGTLVSLADAGASPTRRPLTGRKTRTHPWAQVLCPSTCELVREQGQQAGALGSPFVANCQAEACPPLPQRRLLYAFATLFLEMHSCWGRSGWRGADWGPRRKPSGRKRPQAIPLLPCGWLSWWAPTLSSSFSLRPVPHGPVPPGRAAGRGYHRDSDGAEGGRFAFLSSVAVDPAGAGCPPTYPEPPLGRNEEELAGLSP